MVVCFGFPACLLPLTAWHCGHICDYVMVQRMCVCVCHTLAHVDAANGSYFSGNQATHGGAISADGQAEVSSPRTLQPHAVSLLRVLLLQQLLRLITTR